VPAALKALGLQDKVSIIGEGGAEVSNARIASGEQLMDSPFAYYEIDYTMMDSLFRYYAGEPQVEPAPRPPVWLVTQETIPDSEGVFPMVADYKEQFAKLWGK
jgi:hypothetical protein